MRNGWVGVVILLVCLLSPWITTAWQPRAAASSGREGDPLVVAAASDLQFAFMEMGRLFEEETGRQVTFIFGSTGSLALQIEHGAPADVFAAASADYIEGLLDKGLLISNSRHTYALGQLALVTHREGAIQVVSLADLLRSEISYVALANPAHAPYGRAAQQALQHAGLWDALQPKLVYAENVRQAVQFVQSGNADAGLVALSVAGVPALRHVPVDAGLHQPLEQTVAIVRATPREAAAREFIALLRGRRGRAILERYGFLMPDPLPMP